MNNKTKTFVGIIGAGALASMAMAGGGGYTYGGTASGAVGNAAGAATGGVGNLAGGIGSIAGGGFLGDIGGSVSMGYDTEYYYRGVNFGGSPIWTGVDLEFPLAEGLTLNPGVWYINPTSGAAPLDDELDYYVNLGWESGDIGVTLGYTAYTFPEAGGDTNEVGIALAYAVGAVDLGVGYYYDIDLESSYIELSAGTTFAVTDGIGVSVQAKLGSTEDDLTHGLVVASLPIALSANATLEPYIAGNFALDALEGVNDEDEDIFGGVSLSVGF